MTHLKNVPEIEALSETSWRRIERDVFAELDRSPELVTSAPETPHWLQRWRWPLMGIGLSLAAAAALLVVLRGSINGPSQFSRIVTDEAPVALTVGRAAIRVAPTSVVWVQSSTDHEVMVMLEAGRVDCRVAHDEHQPPLVVQAGDVRVEVVGTSFGVMREDGATEVEVHEGVVKIFHDGHRVLVGAGQRWTSGDTRLAAASDTAAVAQPGTGSTRADPDTTAHSAAEGAQPAADSATGAPAVAAAQAQPATQAARPATQKQPVAQGQPGATARADARPARQAAPSTHAESAETGADGREAAPKQRYEKAARLEATEPAAAIAIYRELARGNSAWAANALFAQARLELDRGNRREAGRLLREYLRRHPNGNNAADARALLDAAE
jgi:hypothetical protein